jgi:hypothetical protein
VYHVPLRFLTCAKLGDVGFDFGLHHAIVIWYGPGCGNDSLWQIHVGFGILLVRFALGVKTEHGQRPILWQKRFAAGGQELWNHSRSKGFSPFLIRGRPVRGYHMDLRFRIRVQTSVWRRPTHRCRGKKLAATREKLTDLPILALTRMICTLQRAYLSTLLRPDVSFSFPGFSIWMHFPGGTWIAAWHTDGELLLRHARGCPRWHQAGPLELLWFPGSTQIQHVNWTLQAIE